MGEVDDAFIQEPEHRPKPETVEADNIPLIDLSPLSSDRGALEGLVADIGDACKNWGFFQVINHGVPLHFRQSIESVSRQFFALSKDEKKKVARDEVKPTGYYDTEHTKNVRDWKEVFDFTVEEPMIIPASHDPHDNHLKQIWNQWPHNPPQMKEVCLQYVAEMEKLAFKLLELIALSLGLERDRFNGFFKDQTTFIRLNHYPPCPIPDLALGVGRHKDAGALTILAQDDVGGLQVKRKSDGEWILVKPTPNAYIINVGDIIQVWSNDKYESVEHRVKVNAEKERFSTPYFMNPAHDTMVEPLEELVNKQDPAKYSAYNWGKFFANRKRSNFQKLDVENVQIYHFKN
ncbi:2-oxoglutarate and oxygenase superfamily protein [Perilla frutescens var. hirtella]|uniref:2-oxoglutarate and oxygenase superfamily protein n=1 Tax=Perilla frutescens var. hirtella TaxID=608512 RepID=A0AAD4P4H5_PERFH|nr:2-oxoglutarate and oxygenase superfamily protein [Perilla frutescens var. hirtella]